MESSDIDSRQNQQSKRNFTQKNVGLHHAKTGCNCSFSVDRLKVSQQQCATLRVPLQRELLWNPEVFLHLPLSFVFVC